MLPYRIKWWGRKLLGWIMDKPLSPGSLLHHRYQVKRLLGMGSYGISYLCDDHVRNMPCVVKQVRPSRMYSPKGQKAFQYETKILQQLKHPAIPMFYEQFKDRGCLFFSMEYMHGKNVEDLIFDDQALFSEQESLRLIDQLLDIVQYLHDHQIIHRDLRIPNVILDKTKLKVIDFGLARFIGDQPDYEDEEEYFIEKKLRREVAYKSDYYALGHFLLFLLYSTYDEQREGPSGGWEDELEIHPMTKILVRRLLQLDEPYPNVLAIRNDIDNVLNKLKGLSITT